MSTSLPCSAPLVAVCLIAAALLPRAVADEPAAPPLLEPAAEAADYDALIKQLDADQFTERQAASEKLTKAGADAIGALERAAVGDSREARTRAIEILKKHFESDIDSLKSAAKQALEKIAAGDNEMAARLAKDVIEPKPVAPALPPGIRIAPAQIQIQVRGVAGGNGRTVRTKITNGVKEIDAQEGDEKVKIVDDPQNGIKMEITEKKDGKETTRKVEAKNADDLKKKDPEAHKLYEKYNNNGRAIQLRGIQIQPGGVLPIRPGAARPAFRPLRRVGDVRDARQQLEKATKEFDEALEQVKKAIENDRNEGELKQALERLEQVKKEVAEAKEKIAAW